MGLIVRAIRAVDTDTLLRVERPILEPAAAAVRNLVRRAPHPEPGPRHRGAARRAPLSHRHAHHALGRAPHRQRVEARRVQPRRGRSPLPIHP